MPQIKLNINFNLRAWQPRKNGVCPVEARIYAYGRDMKFQTNVFCLPKEWDAKKQRVKPTAPEAQGLNDRLARFLIAAGRAHKYHTETQTPLNRELFDRYLNGTSSATSNESTDFFAFCKEWISSKKKLAPGTVKQLDTELTKLQKFRKTLYMGDITRRFIKDYETYMVNELGNNPNTVQKTMKKLRMFLNQAVYIELLEKNPFEGLTFRGVDPEEIDCLEPHEIETVEKNTLSNTALETARKLFLLQCYSGLAYNDLVGLRPEHITIIDKKEYISKDRGKTDVNALIPLFPKARKILEGFNFFETGKLKVWPIQSYNRFIREAMSLIGMRDGITSHVARKTLAMILANDEENPVSLEVIARILGQKKISTTQKWYAKVRTRRIAAETANFKAFG